MKGEIPVFESRYWLSEMPIGNPYAPENKFDRTYQLPFIVGPAVAGAATAISAAAAAGTAAAIGSAVVATASAIGAIATVAGLAMTVVGAITGDEDLMKIGGYVGLAGGVTGLATSAISGATSAATTAATEGVKAGTQAAGQAATQATTSAASNVANVGSKVAETATQAIQPSITSAGTDIVGKSIQGATQPAGGLLGEAGKAALTPTSMSELPKLGADIGTNAGNVGLQQAPTQTASFFDQLMQPTNLLEIGKIGAGALSGMNKSDQFDRTLELQQQQLQHNIDQDTLHNRNSNYQGRGMLSTRALTQEERDAAAAKKATRAKKMATILTAPAGSQ